MKLEDGVLFYPFRFVSIDPQMAHEDMVSLALRWSWRMESWSTPLVLLARFPIWHMKTW